MRSRGDTGRGTSAGDLALHGRFAYAGSAPGTGGHPRDFGGATYQPGIAACRAYVAAQVIGRVCDVEGYVGRRGAYKGEGVGLRPLVGPDLRVLFVGYNPSIPAYRSGHYYANPSNRFYALLFASGLTPRLLRPDEDVLLPGLGIGVTDLCPTPSAMAHDLPTDSFAAGVASLASLVQDHRPRALCCNGYGVFRALLGRAPVRAGLQEGVRFEDVPVFAVPSSSGAASAYTAERLAAWLELRDWLIR